MIESRSAVYVIQVLFSDDGEWSNEASWPTLAEAESERDWLADWNSSVRWRIVHRVTSVVETVLD